MKFILVISLTLLFCNAVRSNVFPPVLRGHPPPPVGHGEDSDDVTLEYFVQNLDHFDPDDDTIWIQRYYLNKVHFNTNSNNVVFLQMGGEEEIALNWSLYGTWVEMGTKYGALMFQLEHRFYGESQPFADTSTEHLKYLSSDQALADTANFIRSMNEAYELPDDVKWIVFGGSYSGSLAAWMRQEYPELVHAAVASSAPVLARLNLIEYFLVTINDMAAISDKCVENLQTAMKQADDIIYGNDEDVSVTDLLNLCTPIEGFDSDHLYVQSFYNRISHIFSSAAQSNGMRPPSVDDLCTILLDEERGDELQRLADIVELKYKDGCISNNYTYNVNHLQTIYAPHDNRVWTYQTCAEFGWFQTTDWATVFGLGTHLNFFTNMCVDIFGPEFDETFTANQIDMINEKHGGLKINVSNVVFVHGTVDPWNLMGVKEPVNPESYSILVEGTAHCADMAYYAPELPQLTAAKKEVDRLVGVWLGVN